MPTLTEALQKAKEAISAVLENEVYSQADREQAVEDLCDYISDLEDKFTDDEDDDDEDEDDFDEDWGTELDDEEDEDEEEEDEAEED